MLKTYASAARIAVVIALLSLLGLGYRYAERPNDPVGGAAARTGAEQTRLLLSTDDAQRLVPGQAGHVGVKSLLNIRHPLRHGEFVWDDRGVPAGTIWIRVDLAKQLLSVFRGGHEIGTAVIMFGADEKPTPIGDFHILWKAKDHRSSLYAAAMPYTLRLTEDGVAIHGANVRDRAASHGCVSVPIAFAKRLFAEAKVGDVVTILPETARKVS